MSIYFEFDVGPSGRRFRRAVDQDKRDVESFIKREQIDKIFGHVDIGALIELSVLSICMINKNKNVVGFMSLDDHPNVFGLDPADWEIWIRNLFQKYYVARSTLFIHCSCCKDSVSDFFLEEALMSVFMNDMYLKQICLVATADSGVEQVLRTKSYLQTKMFKCRTKRDDDSEEKAHLLFVAKREDFCPKLKIRRAVEEDNDDVSSILDKTCPRLKEMYGNYYISEMIGRHPESKREIIVAQYNNKAVGVMCLNSGINYRKLQHIYELKPFFGLRKATPLEKEQHSRNNILLSIFGEPIMEGKFSPFEDLPIYEHLMPHHLVKSRQSTVIEQETIPIVRSGTKVNFGKHFDSTSMEHIIYHDSDDFDKISYTPSYMSQATASSIDLLLEDDPFDYDIVNIDTKLLAVPSVVPSEFVKAENKESMIRICTSKFCVLKPKPKSYKEEVLVETGAGKSEIECQMLYRGDDNAFSIELFGLREDIDPRSAYDILEVAFEVMKDFDYCIIRVPSADKSFHLLQHFCYVPTKSRMCCKYSLYVAHRNAIIGNMRVRPAEIIDIPLITRLLQTVQSKETVYTIENSILGHEESRPYVFMSGLSLVGIGIVNVSENLNFLRTRYSMETYHNHRYHLLGQSVGTGITNLKVVIVYPAFEVHYRFFIREMMRMSGSYSLVWMTAYRNKWVAYKANSLVMAMKPLMPRKFALDFPSIPELKNLAAMENKIFPFSSWFLDKKLTSIPMMTVSTRIVLLGASTTAMALINALVFDHSNTYLCFTGVTLISAKGLPYLRHENEIVEKMFPKFHNNTDKYLKNVPYTYYVNVIQGTVNEINRQDKHVTLTNGNKFYYDLLFLLFGKQYQHPDYLEPESEPETTNTAPKDPQSCKAYLRLDKPRKRIIPDLANCHTPENVFIINNKAEANYALKYVRSTYSYDQESTFIVYGRLISAYCCLTALLEIPIPAKNIIFVEPFPPEDKYKTRVSIFYNNNVDETVSKMLDRLGIKVYRSYYFKSWSVYDDVVTQVEFLSHSHLAKLDCTAFFYYGKRGVDLRAYLAVFKSGMGYDGGILIDHEFRTKDPCIYAAGPCTAYYRRYFATEKKHKFYDSYEVGEKLGRQIRNELDPLFTEKTYEGRKPKKIAIITMKSKPDSKSSSTSSKSSIPPSEKQIDKIPKFKKPRVLYCKLPGGLQYLEVRPPGKKIPHHLMQSLDYNGYVLETFKCGYFKLHMNNDLIVDCILCLTPEKYDLEIFKNLYGLSSAALNNVYLRYMTKKLDNFYEYFRSPWAFFLYHDQVDDLFAMVKELLPKSTFDGVTIAEALRKVNISNCSMSSVSDIKKELREKFDATPHIEAVSDYVMEWLAENDVIMPMYVQPSQIVSFVHDLERNYFFKKKTTITKLISNVL